jgi:hypothetical protein
MRQRDLVERGLDPVEARQIAARRFGDVQSIAAACRNIDERWCREQRRATMWMDLRQDVTYGLRVLRKSLASSWSEAEMTNRTTAARMTRLPPGVPRA